MEKKKKISESLKKFQLKNEGKQEITGGIGGPAYTTPSWSPTTQTCSGGCTYSNGTMEGPNISYDWN